MLATRIAATGTSVSSVPEAASRQRITARSFLQKSLLDSLQRNGIHIPGVAGNVRDLLDADNRQGA